MGLLKNDLQFLVDNIIEIDSYNPKMGNDEDIIIQHFQPNGNEP